MPKDKRPKPLAENEQAQPTARKGRISQLWLLFPYTLVALSVGAALAHAFPRFRWESLPLAAAIVATGLFALLINRLLLQSEPAADASPIGEGLRQLLDSAGPAVIALDLNGRMIYCNPATERLLGYRAVELMEIWGSAEILAPGESARMLAELQKLCHIDRTVETDFSGRMGAYLECVRNLPPSMVPNFNVNLVRKDGRIVQVALHISALRDTAGELTGTVAVAVDESAANPGDLAHSEMQERYRDLFEHSNEMIATLSPAGRFLYANPAWERCFGLDSPTLENLRAFEDVFSEDVRSEVAGLFRRALDGETIERAPLRHHTLDGRTMEMEIGLSRRQTKGAPLAVRCQLRDVTQQKKRENRLVLQLAISQLMDEGAPGETTSLRILEALSLSQGWDVAIEWVVGTEQQHLQFATAWGSPGRHAEALIQQSMSMRLSGIHELPERAWREGQTVWLSDLASAPLSTRIHAALSQKMVSGWAVPVRAGKNVLAVLEFYSSFRLREDADALAAVETAAAALGQMLAESQKLGSASEPNRQQEQLLDAMTDGIFSLDRTGNVTYANPAAARLLSTPAEAMIGRPVHDLLHGAAPAGRTCAPECPLRKAETQLASATGEDKIYRDDGSSFPAEYSLSPIRSQGRPKGAVLSIRDISQRSALDRMKDEFISTVSHELRTPLTSIRGALGLLTSGILGETSEKASHLLRIALGNSDRLVHLINDILDLERMQSGRAPLALRTVQLADVVKQSIEEIQPMADAAGVQLIHDATQVEITADTDRLLQVVTNLLSNAVKFSPPNSPVSVMLRPGVTGVILSVIDHGRGIPADKLEAIFGRFQQVDASDSRQKGGTGLGLAICRTIVMQHSGRIWAERNPVRGSTFRIFLPYQPAPQAAVGAPLENEPGRGTVVLADGNADTRPRIAAQLARHGYAVVQASTVEQALSAARQDAQAILLDASFDGRNGWEILPLLRRTDATSRTPVVLMSVENQQSSEELPAGADGWVAKPLQEDALLAELARVLCGSGDKARILIVEDDRDLARIIGEVFARDSIVVQTAHSLQATIEQCNSFQPHLMLLDIGLPDGDGFNVVDWLRQHESLSRLPLVVYSGRELSAEERRQLTLGPTYFLAKTRVQPQQLEALVLTMLRSSRQKGDALGPEAAAPNS